MFATGLVCGIVIDQTIARPRPWLTALTYLAIIVAGVTSFARAVQVWDLERRLSEAQDEFTQLGILVVAIGCGGVVATTMAVGLHIGAQLNEWRVQFCHDYRRSK